MDISLILSMLLRISTWIALDVYGYSCIDLLWVLDPGIVKVFMNEIIYRTSGELLSKAKGYICPENRGNFRKVGHWGENH